jgi:hypothetical protein
MGLELEMGLKLIFQFFWNKASLNYVFYAASLLW